MYYTQTNITKYYNCQILFEFACRYDVTHSCLSIRVFVGLSKEI